MSFDWQRSESVHFVMAVDRPIRFLQQTFALYYSIQFAEGELLTYSSKW